MYAYTFCETAYIQNQSKYFNCAFSLIALSIIRNVYNYLICD